MKQIMRFFLFLFSFSFLAIANAASSSASTDLAGLLNNIHTMKADVLQIVYDNRDQEVQRSYGNMAIERPGKFYWKVTKPIPQLIIANQSRLWIYDQDLDQVTIRPLSKVSGDTPALLLSYVDSVLDKNYTVREDTKGNALRWFVLTPRNPDSLFATIKIGFAKTQLQEMRLQDHIGHRTEIQFKNIQTNVPLSANLFVFKAPANVDVIDETKKG